MNLKTTHSLVDRVASVVLAGGQGTRLFPLTITRCKPAVCFAGRYRLVDVPISNSLHSHITKVFVISQYFASHLNHHIGETFPLDLFHEGTLQLLSPEETSHRRVWYKGTADAVRQNLDYLQNFPVDYFLILSGDQLYMIDFLPVIAFAKEEDADLVIMSHSVEAAEAKRMGLLKVDERARVVAFEEKPGDEALKQFQLPQSSPPRYFGSMGIYVFKRDALFDLLRNEGDDFGRHLIPTAVKQGKTLSYPCHTYWEDIGTILSYYNANLALTRGDQCLDLYNETRPIYTRTRHLPSAFINNTHIVHSIISQGACIEAQEITQSVIGVHARIKRGTIIRDSIILGDDSTHTSPTLHSIEEDCLIQRAIIDEEVTLGKGVRLTNEQQLQSYDGEGIFIRDGIIVVPSGSHLPDGFVL